MRIDRVKVVQLAGIMDRKQSNYIKAIVTLTATYIISKNISHKLFYDKNENWCTEIR